VTFDVPLPSSESAITPTDAEVGLQSGLWESDGYGVNGIVVDVGGDVVDCDRDMDSIWELIL